MGVSVSETPSQSEPLRLFPLAFRSRRSRPFASLALAAEPSWETSPGMPFTMSPRMLRSN